MEKKLSSFTFQEGSSTDSNILVKHLQEELRNFVSLVSTNTSYSDKGILLLSVPITSDMVIGWSFTHGPQTVDEWSSGRLNIFFLYTGLLIEVGANLDIR